MTMFTFPHAIHRLNEKTVQPALQQPALQQPKPKLPRPLYASFLRNFVDPVPPNCAESVHTLVSEWLESVGLEREKHCRSENYLQLSGDTPVSRYFTRSAPEMDHTLFTDGGVALSTPTPDGVSSYQAVTNTGSVGLSYLDSAPLISKSPAPPPSLVQDPLYRSLNLAANNIYMQEPDDDLPEHIAELIARIRPERDSPGPSLDKISHDADLRELENGAGECDVENYFKREIFPTPMALGSLKRTDRQRMAKHTVPSSGSEFKLSTPAPDMLYGYDRSKAFPQQAQLIISMRHNVVANNKGLIYPFFVIEFKGEGGSMFVATNQCLGASASCVNVAERLNHQLKHCMNAKLINSATFSMAVNGSEARLYISWKDSELNYYYTHRVEGFYLQEPASYLQFRKYVRNIIDWGNGQRMTEIRKSLDCLLEESINRSSEATKFRQSPSDSSGTSRTKNHKSSPAKAQNP